MRPAERCPRLLFFARCLWQLDPTSFNAILGDFDGFTAGYDGKRILGKTCCPLPLSYGLLLQAIISRWQAFASHGAESGYRP
jgi:hypothetical protein